MKPNVHIPPKAVLKTTHIGVLLDFPNFAKAYPKFCWILQKHDNPKIC